MRLRHIIQSDSSGQAETSQGGRKGAGAARRERTRRSGPPSAKRYLMRPRMRLLAGFVKGAERPDARLAIGRRNNHTFRPFRAGFSLHSSVLKFGVASAILIEARRCDARRSIQPGRHVRD
jgi:hypothetical protein